MIEGFLTCYFGLNVILTLMITLSDVKYYKQPHINKNKFDINFFVKKSFIYLIFGIIWLLIYFWEEILK